MKSLEVTGKSVIAHNASLTEGGLGFWREDDYIGLSYYNTYYYNNSNRVP